MGWSANLAVVRMEVRKPKIKVMRIIARMNVGGPAVHCDLLSNRLSEYGYETVLVTGSIDSEEKSYEELFAVSPQGYRLVRLPKLTRLLSPLGDLKTLWSLIRLMRQEKPDIVHTHTAKAGLVGRIAAFVCGVPVVVHTYHGHVLSGYFSNAFSKMLQLLDKTLALRTTAIVTLSESLKKELSQKFRIAPEAQFHIIPLGRELKTLLATPRKNGALRKELGLPTDTLLFGIVGRLVPIKAHEQLLHAMKAIPHVHLAVVGEGPLQESLQFLAQSLGLKERVHFLGWRSDLENIYSDLDCSVLCSKNEGTPLSMIESFAAGCPVVATAVGGIADMLTARDEVTSSKWSRCAEGILVERENLVALEEALKEMAEDSSYRVACSLKCRDKADGYTSETLTKRMAGLYSSLLSKREGVAC